MVGEHQHRLGLAAACWFSSHSLFSCVVCVSAAECASVVGVLPPLWKGAERNPVDVTIIAC